MSDTVIKIENLSKQYRLGVVNTGTLSHDLNRWWALVRGKEDPTLAVTESNDRAHAGYSDYVWALKDINLEVKQGDVLGVIGRNAAGKSTLLKILSRITAPTTGGVKVKGRIASLLEVGTGFHPELTGRENVYLNGAILGMTRKEVAAKLDEIIDFSGCERFIDTPVKRYSSGMMVRLGFAVAAHLEPEILVVDEVLAVGDAEFQKKCLGKMRDVASHGRTVLFVSHNMAAIEALCTKSVLLQNGEVGNYGAVATVVGDYLHFEDVGKLNSENLSDYIKSVSILDKTNTPVQTIATGEQLFFSIDLNLGERCVNSPKIGIGINTMLGERIVTITNYFSTSELPALKGSMTILCEVLNQNLAPGRYQVKLAAGDSLEDFDVVENAFEFNIEPRDYFGNGRLPSNRQGKVIMKSNWSIQT